MINLRSYWTSKPHLQRREGVWICKGAGRSCVASSPSVALMLWRTAHQNHNYPALEPCLACGNTHPHGMPCPHMLTIC